MLHASIQVYVTEFAPAARSSAVAFHTFSFFVGGGISPVLYGIGLERLGAPVTLSIAGIAMVLIGAISAQLLVKPKPSMMSAAPAIGRDALVRHPDALRQLARSARTRRSACRRADTSSRRCAAISA